MTKPHLKSSWVRETDILLHCVYGACIYLGMRPEITSYFFIVFISAKLASINQSGSLNLFSSKEIELEQRALLLKRLAFVIYCSNEDQYQKQVPDIQGTYL